MLRVRHHRVGAAAAGEGAPRRVFFAEDDLPGPVELDALQRTQPRGSGADDQHRVPRPDLGDLRGPVARRQQIAHKESLAVRHGFRNDIQPLVGVGDTDKFRLAAVDAAAQGPAAVGVRAVVDPAVTAEEAVPAEGLHVHSHPVPGPQALHGRPDRFHHAHHLVAHGDAGYRPGHGAVFDVQVAGADAGQGHPHQGVPVCQQHRLRLFQEGKFPPLHIRIGQHIRRLPSFFTVRSPAGGSR